jgi:hypothetical protein
MIGSVNFGRPGPFFAGATPVSIALACCRFDISVSICLIMSFVSMTPPNTIITKNKFSYGTVRHRIPLGGHTFVGHQYSKTKPQDYSPIFRSEQQTVRCGLPVNQELSGNLYLAMMATSAVRSPGTTLGFRHCASRTHVREEIKRQQLPIQSPVGRLLRGDQILSPVCCLLRLPPPTVEVVDPMSHKVDLKSVAGVYLFLAGRHPLIPLKE